jgi:hypothetical protein
MPRVLFTSIAAALLCACLAIPPAAAADSRCPNASETCGPTFTLPQWGDAGGWKEPDQYNTIQFGAVLGNGRDQLIGKSASGIAIWDFDTRLGQWRPAVDDQGKPMMLTYFADPPPLTQARPRSGGLDFTALDQYVSIRVADVMGTGRDQIIARAGSEIIIFSYTPANDGTAGTWSGAMNDGPFSDWNTGDDATRALVSATMQTADLTGDGKDELFTVTAKDTLAAYEWKDGGFTQLPATRVSIPVTSAQRATVHASPPIDGRQEIWWADTGGVAGLRLDEDGKGWSYVPQKPNILGWTPFLLAETAPTPWGQAPYYETIRLVNIAGSSDRQVVGRGVDGLEVWRQAADGSWQQRATLTALSDASGFAQEKYWATIRFANLDGDAAGQQEVIARGPDGVAGYRYDATRNEWDRIAGSIALTDDPWGSDASYFSTFRVGDASGTGRQDTLIARGPYGIRTWFYGRPNETGWTGYLPSGYQDFTGDDATAYSHLNTLAQQRGWLAGDPNTGKPTPIRAAWTGGNRPTGLESLQSNLASLCGGVVSYVPPQYQSCGPPASGTGSAVEDWTRVVNTLLAEVWSAGRVVDFYDELDDIRQKTFNVQSANLPALAGQLNLAAATNTGTTFNWVAAGSATAGVAASLAGLVEPELSAALWVAAEVISALPSASPSLTSRFDGTYNQLQTQFANGVAEVQAQHDSQSLQVRSDPNLLRLVAELRQAGTWTLDDDGIQSASNQGFALWIYKSLLPVMYTRYQITNCQPDQISGDEIECSVPSAGSGVLLGPGAPGQVTSFSAIGPSPVAEGLDPGTPCRILYDQYGSYGKSCTYQGLDASIGDKIWGLVASNCDYRPNQPDTVWKPSCSLGVDPQKSVLPVFSTKENWAMPTWVGDPVAADSGTLGGAARRTGAERASSLGRAATVRLHGVVHGVRRVDLSRARVVLDRVLYDRGRAGELVRHRRSAGRARATAVAQRRPRSLGGTRLRSRGGGIFRGRPPAARASLRPTVELKLAHRPRSSLAFSLRLDNVSLPVLHGACDPAVAKRIRVPIALHSKLRILQPGRRPVAISLHPRFRCQRDATGEVHALSVVKPKRPKLGRGVALRIQRPRRLAVHQRGTLRVAVRNASRTTPAQDVVVSAYVPAGMRVLDRPRGAEVRRDRVVWRLPKLGRRHTRSFRIGVVSARTGRRCAAFTADAVLRRRTAARACVDVGPARARGVTG